jgi:hypothetical protein
MVTSDTKPLDRRDGGRSGSGLARLAAELMTERQRVAALRRRVLALRRENDELRAELVLLRRTRERTHSSARLSAVRDVLRRQPT